MRWGPGQCSYYVIFSSFCDKNWWSNLCPSNTNPILHYACSSLWTEDNDRSSKTPVGCFLVARQWTQCIDTACIMKYKAIQKLLLTCEMYEFLYKTLYSVIIILSGWPNCDSGMLSCWLIIKFYVPFDMLLSPVHTSYFMWYGLCDKYIDYTY